MSERQSHTNRRVISALLVAEPALQRLDWSRGLTRSDILVHIPDFPHLLYLRLPSSKRFASAHEVVREICNADARADGEFTGSEDLLDEREVLDFGGPPAWGDDPLLSGLSQPGGSATDTEDRYEAEDTEIAE